MTIPLAQSTLLQFVLGHLRVTTNVCTQQRHEHGYRLEPRTVPDYNLIHVTRGRVVWVVDEVEHVLEPGAMVIVPPGVGHWGYSRTKRMALTSLHVEATLPGGQDVFDLLRPPRVIRAAAGSPLDDYLRGAQKEFDRPTFHDALLMLAGWSRLVVIELLRQAGECGQLQPRSIDPFIVKVLDHLAHRLASPLTLDDLATFSGYTPQHLNRLFRRVLGVTPLQYLTRLRMDHAAAMLVEDRLTVKAIAEAVGYEDPYYFSRAFRQHFGRSPAQYREQAGSDSPSGDSAGPFPRGGGHG